MLNSQIRVMKKFSTTICLALCMNALIASDITLSLGDYNIGCSGEKVYISITIDYITPGEEIAGWQFFIWHDQSIITWDGSFEDPEAGINYLSPLFPNSAGGLFDVNANSELVYLWGDGNAFANLAGQNLPYTIIELTFTYHGGEGGSLIWGTSGKMQGSSLAKGTTEVYTWEEFDYFVLTLHDGSLYLPLCLNTFLGTINNDWFEPGNWCYGCVPVNTDAWIDSYAINMPVVFGGIAMTQNLNIYPGGILTVASNGGLTIKGNLSNNGQLIIQSDSSGNSGTLINEGEIAGSGSFEFNRIMFCSGTNSGNPGTIGSHFLSSPFGGFTTDDLFDYLINAWNQPDGTWLSYDPLPIYGPCTLWPATPLTVMDAWKINFNQNYPDTTCIPPLPPGTGLQIEFTASAQDIHSGTYERTLGYGSGSDQEWNLVGNPYPSALDLNSIVWGENTVQAAYLYDGCTGNYLYWAKGLGPYAVAPNSGFFVETAAPGIFTVADSNRIHPGDISCMDVPNLLTIKVTGNNQSDLLYIRFAEDATAGFDLNGDAHKIFTETEGLPQVYTRAGEEMLAINALPATTSVPMSLISNVSGYYSINAIETSNFNYLT